MRAMRITPMVAEMKMMRCRLGSWDHLDLGHCVQGWDWGGFTGGGAVVTVGTGFRLGIPFGGWGWDSGSGSFSILYLISED